LEEKRVMPIKRYKPEQIVTMLRQIEVSIANGKTTPQACKEAEITMQTFYRWRKEYGGLKMDQAKRLKELEKENGKLKRLVAELSLDKQILRSCNKTYRVRPHVVAWNVTVARIGRTNLSRNIGIYVCPSISLLPESWPTVPAVPLRSASCPLLKSSDVACQSQPVVQVQSHPTR
jgi:putative transposase